MGLQRTALLKGATAALTEEEIKRRPTTVKVAAAAAAASYIAITIMKPKESNEPHKGQQASQLACMVLANNTMPSCTIYIELLLESTNQHGPSCLSKVVVVKYVHRQNSDANFVMQ